MPILSVESLSHITAEHLLLKFDIEQIATLQQRLRKRREAMSFVLNQSERSELYLLAYRLTRKDAELTRKLLLNAHAIHLLRAIRDAIQSHNREHSRTIRTELLEFASHLS